MSHNIFGSRFISVREPAWHRIGTVIQNDVTALEALRIAGLDFDYEKAPVFVKLPNGEMMELDRQAVVRSPTSDDNEWRTLGIVGENYSILSNEELAKGLDALSEATGWKFETAGALDSGKRVFMTLSTGSKSIKNDEYQSYVVVSDAKGTGESLQILLAPTRVVCHNTLIMAKNSSMLNVRLNHGSNLSTSYSFWSGMMSKLEHQQTHMFNALDVMANQRITDDQLGEFVDMVFPLPVESVSLERLKAVGITDGEMFERLSDAHDYWTNRASNNRLALVELYNRFNDSDENTDTNNSQFAGTAYAALQAATEIADWGGRNSKTAAQSALFGNRAAIKQRAWSAAEALI